MQPQLHGDWTDPMHILKVFMDLLDMDPFMALLPQCSSVLYRKFSAVAGGGGDIRPGWSKQKLQTPGVTVSSVSILKQKAIKELFSYG